MSFSSKEDSQSVHEQEEEADDDPDYEVLAILDVRKKKGKVEYKVKWKDIGDVQWSLDEHDTWQEESTLSCPDLVDAFNERRKIEKKQERERSTSSSRKSEKKTPKKLRRAAASEEEEDNDDTPRTERKKKKRAVIASEDEEEEESRSRSSTRSRSRTVDSKDDESSSVRRSGRGTKTTDARDSAGPSSSSSHRRSPDPFVVPSTPKLKAPKPEPISPEKSARREPQSAITNEKELNKFKGRGKVPFARGREEAYASAAKLEKDKKKKNRRIPPPVQPPPTIEHDDADGQSLFRNTPNTVVKTEIHGDSSFDGMDEGMGRMDMQEDSDEEGSDDRESDRIDDTNGEEGKMESPQTESSTEDGDGRETLATPGTGSLASVDPVNEHEDEKKEREDESATRSSVDEDENRLVIDEGEQGEGIIINGEVGEGAVDNGLQDQGSSDDEEMDVLNFNPNPTGRNGYDDNLKGTIVDNASFRFDTGEEVDFFRVVFLDLDRSQWIRREIVKEKDRHEYNRYMLKLAADYRRAEIAEGAANYRAARARIEREEREAAEGIVRE